MTQDQTKKVVEETEKSFQEKKQEKTREKIKEIVTEYLKHIDELDTKIDELQEEKKQLKLTLEDLKTGKLDILAERLKKDPKAKKVNIIEIRETHIHHDHYNPYYVPYVINYPVYPTTPINPIVPWQNPVIYGTCNGGSLGMSTTTGIATSGLNCATVDAQFAVNGSDCKAYSIGTYEVSGNVVNFR